MKATDSLANNRWSSSIGAKLGIRDSDAGQWRKPSGWSTKTVGKAYGGSILVARGATASLSTDFYGTAAAVAASVGPGRGSIRLRIDGGPWQTVSLKLSTALHRKVVWRERLPQGAHTIDIQGLCGQSTSDALLFSGSLDPKRASMQGEDAVAFTVIPRRLRRGHPELGAVLGRAASGAVSFELPIALWGARYASFERTWTAPV